MQKKSIKILCITAVLVLIAAGIAGSYWFCPVIYASFRSLFWPEKVYWIETLCGGKKYLLPLYYKCEGYQSFRNIKLPVLVLCNLPLPSDSYQHLKIFPNGIGIFQTPAEWFVVRKNYLHLKSGSCLTIPVEDDMKGWRPPIPSPGKRARSFTKSPPHTERGGSVPALNLRSRKPCSKMSLICLAIIGKKKETKTNSMSCRIPNPMLIFQNCNGTFNG